MAGLRISVDSADAVRGAKAAQEALRNVGAVAVSSEAQLEELSRQASATGAQLGSFRADDPLGIKVLLARADAALLKIGQLRAAQEALRASQARPAFGAGLETATPFGAGLGGSFSAAELGIGRVTAAEHLAKAGADQLTASLIAAATTPTFARHAESLAALAASTLGAAEAQAGLFGLSTAENAAADAASRLSAELVGATSVPGFERQTASVQELAAATQGAAERWAELFSLQQSTPAPSFSGLLTGETFIDPRGLELIEGQKRSLGEVGAKYGQAAQSALGYGTQASSALSSVPFTAHIRNIIGIGAAFAGIQGIRGVVDQLKQYDSAMVEIRQSTNLTEAQLAALDQKLIGIGTSIAVPIQELRELAAVAGRLEIREPAGIEQFVRDAANLRASIPGLGGSIENLGNSLGALSRLSGDSPRDIGKIGDAIARLDDQFNATGDAILETAIHVARAGSGFIESATDAVALGAAMAAMGADGRLASSGIATILTTITEALDQGGPKLQALQQVTGKTREELKSAFQADGATAFVNVLQSIAGAGASTTKILAQLGFESAQDAKAVLPAIENFQQFRRALDEGRDAVANGGDAAAEARENYSTLVGQLQVTKNIFSGLTTESTTLGSALKETVGFANQVAVSFLGTAVEGVKVGEAAQAVAAGLEGAATAAAVLVSINVAQQLASWTRGAYSAATAAQVLTGAYGEALAVQRGLSLTSLAGFLATGPGILAAVGAVGGLTAGITALVNALDSEELKAASADFTRLTAVLDKLDQTAASLKGARAIQVRAEFDDDATAQVHGLEEELRALDAVQTQLLGSLGEKLKTAAPGLDFSKLDPGDLRAEFEKLGPIPIPTAKLKELDIAELVPQVKSAGDELGKLIGQAMNEAWQKEQAAFAADETGFLALADPVAVGVGFVNDVAKTIGEKFGPEIQAKLSEGLGTLDLRSIGLQIQVTGAVPEDLAKLAAGFEDVGGAVADTLDVYDALGKHVDATRAKLEAARKEAEKGTRAPPPTLSDFYRDEANKIREQVTQAQLALSEFTTPAPIELEATFAPVTTFGIEAKIAAIHAEAKAYGELLEAKQVAGKVDIGGGQVEVQSLIARAQELEQFKIRVVEAGEAQRRLGTEQELLGRQSGLLNQHLQSLGFTAQSETSQAFEILRQQIEITRQQAEKGIQLNVELRPDEIAKMRAFADAERLAALRAVDLQENLSTMRRTISEVGNAAGDFSRGITDGLLGIQDPLEALRKTLQNLAADFLQPRIEAALLGAGSKLFGPSEEKQKKGAIDPFRQAAEQQGIGDVFRDFFGQGPQRPPKIPGAELDDIAELFKRAQKRVGGVPEDSGLFKLSTRLAGASEGVVAHSAATKLDTDALAAHTAILQKALLPEVPPDVPKLDPFKEKVPGLDRFGQVEQGPTKVAGTVFSQPDLPGLDHFGAVLEQAATGAAVPLTAAGNAAESAVLPMTLISRETGEYVPIVVAAREAVTQFAAALATATLLLQKQSVQAGANIARQVGGAVVAGAVGGSTGGGVGGGGLDLPLVPGRGPSVKGGSTTVIQHINTVNVEGGRSPIETGLRYSLRQFERDLRSRESRRG